ncbi:MAG: alpha/beta fold hydrolase [Polyangiales bacterium]
MAYVVWEIGAIVVLLLSVAYALVWSHLHYWVRRLRVPLEYASVERIECEDGGVVELRRVPIPPGVAKADLPPIVLMHGLAANHRNQDLHPDHSLARHLAALGRDVWLPTLRSGQPRQSLAILRKSTFSAMAKHDVPRAIEAVLAHTGASQVDYVGFSMGGMLLYAVLDASVPRSKFRRVVTVGSPAEVRSKLPVPKLLRFVPSFVVPPILFRLPARIFAFAAEWVPATPMHRWVLNPDNMPDGMTRVALVDLIEDIPAALIEEFMRWSTGDGTIRVDGEPILPKLAHMDMPALFVAGSADHLAPPEAVKHAFDIWGAREKRFVVVGRDYGHQEDYGHGDLAIGARVGEELFPPIARFLGPEGQADSSEPQLGTAAREAIDRREVV